MTESRQPPGPADSAVRHGWEPRPGAPVILDNRDSFVFNLAHRFAEVGVVPGVVRSDEVGVEELEGLEPSALIVSPGPGGPREAGVSVEAIRRFAGEIPILGVCLGHQAVAVAFGGVVEESGEPMHGMASSIDHDGNGVFEGLEQGFEAARYHSLVVTEVPDQLEVTARGGGFVMGLRHRKWAVCGVQFHPESVLTEVGRALLGNFVERVG